MESEDRKGQDADQKQQNENAPNGPFPTLLGGSFAVAHGKASFLLPLDNTNNYLRALTKPLAYHPERSEGSQLSRKD